jgi:hypothetical protein
MLRTGISRLAVATAVVFVSGLAIDIASGQELSELRRRCSVRPMNCTQMDDDSPELEECGKHNFRIQHACNALKQYELKHAKKTGKGPRYKDAKKKGESAGEVNSATGDQPAR